MLAVSQNVKMSVSAVFMLILNIAKNHFANNYQNQIRLHTKRYLSI